MTIESSFNPLRLKMCIFSPLSHVNSFNSKIKLYILGHKVSKLFYLNRVTDTELIRISNFCLADIYKFNLLGFPKSDVYVTPLDRRWFPLNVSI